MSAHPRLHAALAVSALSTALLGGVSASSSSASATSAASAAFSSSGATSRAASPSSLDSALQDPRLSPSAVRNSARVSRSGSRTASDDKPMKTQRRVVLHKVQWFTPVERYHLTSRFGDTSWLWSSGVHTGLDFAAPDGTPIRSIADGTVVKAGWAGSYGYRTVVRLADGSAAWYCHQSSLAVQVGQQLSAGQLIGYVGSTGNVTGSHVHLEIRQGDTPIDPADLLAAHGVNP